MSAFRKILSSRDKGKNLNFEYTDKLLKNFVPLKLSVRFGNLYYNHYQNKENYFEFVSYMYHRFVKEVHSNLIQIKSKHERKNYLIFTLKQFRMVRETTLYYKRYIFDKGVFVLENTNLKDKDFLVYRHLCTLAKVDRDSVAFNDFQQMFIVSVTYIDFAIKQLQSCFYAYNRIDNLENNIINEPIPPPQAVNANKKILTSLTVMELGHLFYRLYDNGIFQKGNLDNLAEHISANYQTSNSKNLSASQIKKGFTFNLSEKIIQKVEQILANKHQISLN